MRLRTLPALLLAAAAAAAPVRAQVSTEERLCLADYLRVRNDPAEAIPALRKCATQFPDSYQIQRTFGMKLLEEARAGATLDEKLGGEAATALQRAGTLEPERFAADWLQLGNLLRDLGRGAEALEAYGKAEAYLTPSELQDLQDQLWVIYREAGATDKALEVWSRIWHRHEDDFADQLAAGRLLAQAGKLSDAKDRLHRATELDPTNPDARHDYVAVLVQLAESGTASDKKALIDAYLPALESADDELLGKLLVLALDTFSTDAAQTIGGEMLRRDPNAALPNLVQAESLQSAGSSDAALAAARAALAGTLTESQAARAHALVGRILADQAYRAYNSAGDRTSKALVDSTTARYREALSSLRKAEAGGVDVSRDVESVQKAIGALGGAEAQYREQQVAAAREDCQRLGPQAKLAYDRDKPMTRTSAAALTLAVSAGGDATGGTVASGAQVALRDSAWVGGTCWVEVKAPDGTSGWAKQSQLK